MGGGALKKWQLEWRRRGTWQLTPPPRTGPPGSAGRGGGRHIPSYVPARHPIISTELSLCLPVWAGTAPPLLSSSPYCCRFSHRVSLYGRWVGGTLAGWHYVLENNRSHTTYIHSAFLYHSTTIFRHLGKILPVILPCKSSQWTFNSDNYKRETRNHLQCTVFSTIKNRLSLLFLPHP